MKVVKQPEITLCHCKVSDHRSLQISDDIISSAKDGKQVKGRVVSAIMVMNQRLLWRVVVRELVKVHG